MSKKSVPFVRQTALNDIETFNGKFSLCSFVSTFGYVLQSEIYVNYSVDLKVDKNERKCVTCIRPVPIPIPTTIGCWIAIVFHRFIQCFSFSGNSVQN